MFRSLTLASTRLTERFLPDPYVLVLLLTLLVFVSGMLFEGQSPQAMVEHWGKGFWQLLEFSMQMVLVLVTGFVLASTPVFARLLGALARLARTPGQAILLVTVVSLVASWVNWGFGLVIGALFARQLARRVQVDYPLLIASAYSGFIVWHGGLSGSVPLVIATPGHFTEKLIGVVPTSETIFAGFNLTIVLALFVLIPLANRLMLGHGARPVFVDPDRLADPTPSTGEVVERPAEHLEHSRLLALAIGGLGLAYLAVHVWRQGGLNLNIVNFGFLMLGILLHGTPHRFLRSLEEAVKGAAGIIIQFPFYAGIMGMMVGSGLARDLSAWFVSISTAQTLPLFTFWSAGLLNILIPSGGGQWAVQSQVMLPAALELQADVPRTAMAVAWGDAWTNMIQPFWALPALAIAGLRAKDVMGYCLVILLLSGVVISLGFLFL
ncbi:short-chain fatty acid transporter [Rhodospirillum centenum]|uniref:Short chain fatty acid transporter, putative n=1 Tax=Rhodospirillum centenum (strain ATCC 51521 / SW) TaxID=414684 RepID=B6IXN9_RHOCS|nr:short-chain fatty acid transporter [Rhodospirillum centenum]ACJ01063.1 short chain fatty acid transporter, putative [Rhodospirillum centenum SW]